ncbi:MAG: BrnT family toxin [Chloroflexi bacterium]|nr:BrnT family toxin [Chloroflexota bacterium]
MELTFEWDEEKAQENFSKHKVRFEEGKTVFNDPFLWIFPDLEHSEIEQRFLDIGYSSEGRLLVVSHTERGGNVRIISCRKATATERRAYEEGN